MATGDFIKDGHTGPNLGGVCFFAEILVEVRTLCQQSDPRFPFRERGLRTNEKHMFSRYLPCPFCFMGRVHTKEKPW